MPLDGGRFEGHAVVGEERVKFPPKSILFLLVDARIELLGQSAWRDHVALDVDQLVNNAAAPRLLEVQELLHEPQGEHRGWHCDVGEAVG